MKTGTMNPLTMLLFTLLLVSLSAKSVQADATFQDSLPLQGQEPNVRILQADQSNDKISFGTISKEVEIEQQATIKDSNQQPLTVSNETKPNTTSVVKPLQIKINQVNTPIVGKGFKVDNGVSYQRIHVGQLEKKYLFLELKIAEKDKWQKANMTISIQGSQKPLMLCTSTDLDSCYLTRNLLKNDLTLFVQILCEEDCSYSFKGRWSDLEHLFPGQEIVFMFGEDKNQLFHVELNNQEFQEVRVHLSPRATRRPFQNVKMYGKYGSTNDPTQENFDFKSVNLWQDGEGIFLSSKAMKSKEFTLLIVGQSQTTYRLVLELLKEGMHILQNNQHVYEYMTANTIKKYHVKDIDTETNDEFSFKFALLSGEAKIQYFKDSQMSQQILIQPMEYMKDSEYLIPKTSIKDPIKDGIFIRVQTNSRDATFTLKYVGRSLKFPIELHEHIYTFVQIDKNQRFCYFNFKNWLDETEPEKNLRFTVSMINVYGSANPSFRVCKSTLDQCVHPGTFNNFTTELTKISDDTLSQKRIIEFQIPSSLLTKINQVQSQADILVRLQNESGNSSFVALEFLNNNKVLYLREGRPLQQKFQAGELKFYKYINSDPDVSQIRIHINQIAGVIQMQGLIKSGDNSQNTDVTPESSTLRYTKNLTDPIVLMLTSHTKAIVGITMQVIHKSDQHENNNVIVIGQDLIYNVKIQPLTYTVFEVVPIFYQFEFLYSSSQSMIACFLDIDTNKCIDDKGKEMTAPGLSTKSKLTTSILKNKKAKVKITNPFANSVAEVTIVFHSRSLDQCQKRKIGKVYSQLVDNSKCFELALEERTEDLEIYISKRLFSSLTYTLFLCGNSIQGASTKKFVVINSTVIENSCSKSLEGRKLAIQWNVNSVNNTNIINNEKVKVDILVQYKGTITLLSEGVGYRHSQKANGELAGKFGFMVMNKIATKVIITPIRGAVMAYAKIIKESQREFQNISKVDFKFETAYDVDFRQQPIISISQEDFKQAACADCMILIAVYCSGQQGKPIQFDIQVVQKVQSLNENSGINGYIPAKSYAYYTYEADKDVNTTLIFVISDHNERCASLYLGLVQYPTAESKLAESKNQFLTYKHTTGTQRYFLTVQSDQKACEYTLSVLDSQSSIISLQRGKQKLIYLDKGSVQLFGFEHYSGPFKVFAINKFGDVRFHLNQSSIELNKKLFTTKEIPYETFTYKSEHSNVMAVSPKQQIYCTRCNYFLAVQALQNTYSTLFLAYTQTIIPLIHKKHFSDYLEKKSDFTLLSYKRIEKTQLQVTVHKGQIDIMVVYKETRLSQTFSAKSQHQAMLIDVKKDLAALKNPVASAGKKNETVRYLQQIPINIVITAKADDTTYTVQATSVEKESLENVAAYQDILAGQPNHIKISSEKVLCLNGYFREMGEEIIIHTNQEDHEKLDKLIIDAKVKKIYANVQKTIVKNMLTLNVTYNSSKYTGPAAYEICLKFNDEETEEEEEKNLKHEAANASAKDEGSDQEESSFNAIVTQINTINLLPSDSEFIVKGTSTLTINHDGQFLLEVFECEAEGQARIQYGKSLSSAQKSKGKSLEQIGIEGQEHAVKITQEETTTYVIVNSKFSVVRWLPIDTGVDEGTGYLKFKSGDFRYTSKFKNINVEYQPIQTVKENKVKMKIVEYTLLISNDSDKLSRLSRCDKAGQIGVMIIPLGTTTYESDNQKQYLSYDVDKNLLETSFPKDENIYMAIVAKLTASIQTTNKTNNKFKNPSSDEHEHYRFIYSRQQMPLESFKQSKIQRMPYHFILLIVLSIAGLLLLMTYLFTRKIVPILARLKNSNMVEEKEQQAEPEMAEVPPSSDRNQRAVQAVIETDEKFTVK